jgi:hypothetical protein
MLTPVCRTRSRRPVVRAFCPSRLAPAALAQSYERLLPDARRPLFGSMPGAPKPQTHSRSAASA